MFIRTMHFEVDPGKISEFWAEADTVRAKLKVIPGITHQFTAIQPNGDGLSIGIWETEEAAKAGFEKIQSIWTSVAKYLQSPPTATNYPKVEQLAGPAHEM